MMILKKVNGLMAKNLKKLLIMNKSLIMIKLNEFFNSF